MPTSAKTLAPPALTPCPPEVAFRFSDGTVARDLRELRLAVARSHTDTLAHHRSHYHHWAQDILRDGRLAEDLRVLGEQAYLAGESYRSALADLLDKHIARLERNAPKGATKRVGISRKTTSRK